MSQGQTLAVSVTDLPAWVSGWLLFVGDGSEALYLATPAAIAAATAIEITAAMPNQSAAMLNPDAQPPDRFIRYSTDIWR